MGEFWSKQLKDLVDNDVHVIAFDQRNHGASGPSRELNSTHATAMAKMSISGLASDLRDLVYALDLDKKENPITMVGHSMGGMVILKALETFGNEALNVGRLALVDSSLTEFATKSTPEEQRMHQGAGMTLTDAIQAMGRVLGPDGEAVRLGMYSEFFDEDISPEEWAIVEEYVGKAPLEPSVALFHTSMGTFGDGNGMVDIAINNVLGEDVPVIGIALRPSTAKGFRHTIKRKKEANVGGCNFRIVDLAEGLPNDSSGHFSFWSDQRKDVQEEVNKALVDFVHSSVSEACGQKEE